MSPPDSGSAGVAPVSTRTRASESAVEPLADGAAPCDLLHDVPFRRIDVERSVRALTFAFSSGDVGDEFVRLLDKSELAPSSFSPSDFAEDVFLREFVARCLSIRVAGRERPISGALLFRLVSEPPRDIAHTRFRQAILRELCAAPALRKQLEKLHGFLCQFRDLSSRRGVTVPGSGPIVMITGPNSGGKTRLLQSLALSQLLGQAGLFVPAREARLPWVNGLFASLIDRMQADQAEGRLGTELLRIRHLFEVVKAGSMVLMDELCSGTNPSEGEELQELVLEMLGELRPRAFVTTHFLQFAEQLARLSVGLRFLQVELDADERPTYAFGAGVATTSLAHRVAERLGVTRSSLRELMRSNNPAHERTSLVRPRASAGAGDSAARLGTGSTRRE
jgi:hypothetical protein